MDQKMFDEIIVKLEYLTKVVEELKSQIRSKTEDVTLVAKDKMKMSYIKCSQCSAKFDSKKTLNVHIRKCHKQNYQCTLCEYECHQISNLDEHMALKHPNGKIFSCNHCGIKFMSEARMKMHVKMHNQASKIKFCHYFNNLKPCPYERYGCKFKHSDSPLCMYGKMCKKKLCQNKHKEDRNTNDDMGAIQNVGDVPEQTKVDDEVKSKNSLTLEQFEARDIYCDNYCSKEENVHTHTSLAFKKYRGVSDLESMVNIQCDLCEHTSTDMIEHQSHFENSHHDEEVTVSCVFPKCEFEANIREDLIKHFETVHDRWIQKSLRKKCLKLITG